MATNNSWNSPYLTANGQLLIGSTGAIPVATTLTAGTNISITNGAGSISVAASAAGSFTWSVITATSQSIVAFKGYVANAGTLLTFTLPVTAAVGDSFRIAGLGAGGWLIAQNSGQLIHLGSSVTTTGVGGSLASTNQYDAINIVCAVANTTFLVVDGPMGNITVV